MLEPNQVEFCKSRIRLLLQISDLHEKRLASYKYFHTYIFGTNEWGCQARVFHYTRLERLAGDKHTSLLGQKYVMKKRKWCESTPAVQKSFRKVRFGRWHSSLSLSLSLSSLLFLSPPLSLSLTRTHKHTHSLPHSRSHAHSLTIFPSALSKIHFSFFLVILHFNLLLYDRSPFKISFNAQLKHGNYQVLHSRVSSWPYPQKTGQEMPARYKHSSLWPFVNCRHNFIILCKCPVSCQFPRLG